MSALRLGVVPYLNVEPIIHGLRGDARFELVRDVPARIAERLHRGEIDLGMIPSIEYAAGEYALVPGIAIASRGEVRSVRLFHPGPLEGLRRVAVDEASRTSFVLLRILLQARLLREPEYVPMRPPVRAMLEAADAALAIGDAALFFEAARRAEFTSAERAGGLRGVHARYARCSTPLLEDECRALDLGAAWTALTGLPFVYAFWAGRAGAVDPSHVSRLHEALRSGLAATQQIASTYDGLGAAHVELCEAYLNRNIFYELGEEEISGLREFYRRAMIMGAIPRVPELRFYDRS